MHHKDFRNKKYSLDTLIESGKYSGNRFYYKLFIIENIIRIVLHTVMKNEYPSHNNWWYDCAPERYKKNKYSFNSYPGIYQVYLKELNNILRNNRNIIDIHINDIDKLITDIDIFNGIRNKIAHTKYLKESDIEILDKLYFKVKRLIGNIDKKFTIEIP